MDRTVRMTGKTHRTNTFGLLSFRDPILGEPAAVGNSEVRAPSDLFPSVYWGLCEGNSDLVCLSVPLIFSLLPTKQHSRVFVVVAAIFKSLQRTPHDPTNN